MEDDAIRFIEQQQQKSIPNSIIATAIINNGNDNEPNHLIKDEDTEPGHAISIHKIRMIRTNGL